jgi:hypothetical protein
VTKSTDLSEDSTKKFLGIPESLECAIMPTPRKKGVVTVTLTGKFITVEDSKLEKLSAFVGKHVSISRTRNNVSPFGLYQVGILRKLPDVNVFRLEID